MNPEPLTPVCSTAPSVRAKIVFQHIVCHGCVLLVDSEFFVLAVYFLYCSSFETIRIVVMHPWGCF
jgi:hypothetical protein